MFLTETYIKSFLIENYFSIGNFKNNNNKINPEIRSLYYFDFRNRMEKPRWTISIR